MPRPHDLEELLRQRHDQLRGRPEHWTDRLRDWRQRRLWLDAEVMILLAMTVVIVLGALLMLQSD